MDAETSTTLDVAIDVPRLWAVLALMEDRSCWTASGGLLVSAPGLRPSPSDPCLRLDVTLLGKAIARVEIARGEAAARVTAMLPRHELTPDRKVKLEGVVEAVFEKALRLHIAHAPRLSDVTEAFDKLSIEDLRGSP